MDLKKKLHNKSSRENNNMPAKNNMQVFSSDEDDNESLSTFEPEIILHSQPRLANSMSIDSDSDSGADFVAASKQNTYKPSLLSQKKSACATASKCKINDRTPRTNRRNQQKNSPQKLNQKSESTSKQKLNVETPEKDQRINVIINKRVNVNSAVKNNIEPIVKRNPRVKRKIFDGTPSTSTETQTGSESQETSATSISSSTDGTKKGKKNGKIQTDQNRNNEATFDGIPSTSTGTQTGSESQESSAASISSSRDGTINGKKNEKIQTDQDRNNEVTNENAIFISNVNLKRPLSVSTQTEIVLIVDTSSDEEIEEVIKRKVIPIVVSPPKRLKTTDEDCSSPQKKKVEVAKVNLTSLFQGSFTKSTKTLEKCENQKQSSVVKNSSKRSPMKQLTIPQLNFCKNRNTQSANTTPNTSPAKSSPNTSPAKSDKSKKSPEKKETRYTQETHQQVFETVKKIVCWVSENQYFRILFTKSETDLLKKLFDLPDQRLTILCIRLYTRQHKWYNLLNLCEQLNLTNEGFNLKEFFLTLSSGFVKTDYSDEKIELLLDYLTLPDIKQICNSFKIRVLSKKKEMINKLLEYSRRQCTLTSLKRADQILRDHVSKKLGICIKLETNVKDLFYRIHLLYSLTNPDLETPNDIYNLMYKIRSEMIKYPTVKIDSPQLFSDRQDFLKFADACVLRNEFNDTITKKDIPNEYLLCVEAYKRLINLLSNKEQLEFDKSKPMFLRRFSAAWVYCKVLSTGSQKLGKTNPDPVCIWLTEMLKQEVYCIHNRGHWYSQLALVTRAHKKDITGEVQSIIDGLSDKYVNEVQKHDLSIRGSKIRKIKISQLLHDQLQCSLLPETEIPVSRTIQANVVHNNEPGKKLKFVRTTAEGKEYGSVEETALNYYKTENNYTHGIHCEGQLLDALFVVLFWDILYRTHIPNTFITELQSRPLDLFSTEFYSNRTDKINDRLKDIRDGWTLEAICEIASKVYSKYSAELKSIVSFDFVEEGTFHVIIKSIGTKLLAAIFERFAKDYKQFHSGLPDLFLWNCNELKCCFVEVKSENDRLSTKQILWINYLHKFGAKVEVCHVQHVGSRSTKNVNKRKGKEDK